MLQKMSLYYSLMLKAKYKIDLVQKHVYFCLTNQIETGLLLQLYYQLWLVSVHITSSE